LHEAVRLGTDLLCESATSRYSRRKISTDDELSGLEVLPDLPSVGDFLPGYEASNFRGIGAPKQTPVEIVEKLNEEINSILADPNVKARIADIGGTVLPGSPADFGKLIADETEKWGKVIRGANIKLQ
jgi:tripartite-type tricarboxylate transporter receptor subunit TctC